MDENWWRYSQNNISTIYIVNTVSWAFLICLGWFLACCKGKIYINCRDQYFWAWESVGLRKQPTHYASAFFYKCQPQNQHFPGQAFHCTCQKINNSHAQHFIVPATKSTFSGPSILLYLPKNQHFPGPAFYCFSHKINIFQAQNFIVPGCKTNSLQPHHFIVPGQPGCKINNFWPQHFIPMPGSKIYNVPAQAQLPYPSRVVSLVHWTHLQQVKMMFHLSISNGITGLTYVCSQSRWAMV